MIVVAAYIFSSSTSLAYSITSFHYDVRSPFRTPTPAATCLAGSPPPTRMSQFLLNFGDGPGHNITCEQ